MDSLMNVSPGAIIWTIINFCIVLFIILKFGAGPIIKGLKAREDKINKEISDAEEANREAKELLAEAQGKIDNAQKEMAEIVAKGRKQAEEQIAKATDEADRAKRQKVEDAARDV